MRSRNEMAAALVLGIALFSMMACGHRTAKITSFTVSPNASFTVGQTAQLCYELVNAVSAQIEPEVGQLKEITRNCLQVAPRQTTTYRLQATGRNGAAVTTELTVNVAAPPPLATIIKFEAKRDGTSAGPGSQAEICYEVNGANNLEISPDIGKLEPVDKGCRTVTPGKTTTYELAATGADNQTVKKEATVSVVQPPARIVRFDVSPENIKAGEKVSICYQVVDAVRASISNLNYKLKLGPSECVDVWPKRSTVLTLEARNLDGQAVSQPRRVTVEQPEIVILDFSAQSPNVELGSGTLLHYNVSNAATVEISSGGKGVDVPPGEGNQRITPGRTATYTLTAKDLDGKSTQKSIVVNVVPPAQARILKFDPPSQKVVPPRGGTLCYGVTWDARVSLYSQATNTSLPLDSLPEKCINVPARRDHYILTAIGKNNKPVTREADVTIPGPSARFGAKTPQQVGQNVYIGRGDPVALCYQLSNVASAQISPIGVRVGGTNCLKLGELTSTMVYTLSYTGFDDTTNTAQATINLYPPPRIVRFDNREQRYGPGVLCYAFENGARAIITPQFGEVRGPSGCVRLPSQPSFPYTLTVYGFGKVTPAVSLFPR